MSKSVDDWVKELDIVNQFLGVLRVIRTWVSLDEIRRIFELALAVLELEENPEIERDV